MFDERVCLSDVKRRAKKELRQGGCDLKAAMMTRYPMHSSKGPYEVVRTALVSNGEILKVFKYDSAGRVKSEDKGTFTWTDEFPACCHEHEKPGAKIVCHVCQVEVQDGVNGRLYGTGDTVQAVCTGCENDDFFSGVDSLFAMLLLQLKAVRVLPLRHHPPDPTAGGFSPSGLTP